MKQLVTLCLASAIFFIAGCSEPQRAVREPVARVKVIELNVQEVKDTLYFPAIANAAERSQLSFRVNGEISRFLVKEGNRVKKGQVLAILEPTDYQLDVDNASARFVVIDSQFKRSQPLVDKGLLAKSQFDEIAAQRKIARSELELAKLRLSFTELKAPMDGVISRINAEQFENVRVGQQIVNIHSIDSVEVLIQLPDRLYTRQPTTSDLEKVDAWVRLPSGNQYLAKVKEFTTEPNPNTGTFTVTLMLPMPSNEIILDGMAVDVTSKSAQVGVNLNQGVNVPITAVFNADGDDIDRANKFVWLVRPDLTVTKRQIVIGQASKSTLQVLDGLNPMDKIVTAGLTKLREGMKVEVVKQEVGNE